MSDTTTAYQCPSCTGPLHFNGKTGKLECDYCGSSFTPEEIEKIYAQKNAQAAAQETGNQATSTEETFGEQASAKEASGEGERNEAENLWGEGAQHMRAYTCENCGAELICEESTAATSCPYCGNPTIIPGQFSGVLRPDYVIPFKMDQKEAVDSLKGYYKGKILLPRKFANANHIEKIQGIYVPFWMYDMTVDADAQFHAENMEVFRRGNEEVTRIKHYEVRREGTLRFEKIPVDGSKEMPDDLMDSIEPYNYGELKNFSMSYLPGYLANRYDEDSDQCKARAKNRACETALEELRSTVTGYGSVNVTAHHEKVKNVSTQYALMPVYILSTQWQNKNFLFALNGQTGKMTGNLPVSKTKFSIWTAAVWVVLFLLFGNFLTGFDDAVSVLEAVIFALIPALLIAFALYKQLKPVAVKTDATGYMAKGAGGLKLRVRQDRYVRTTETVRVIQNPNQNRGRPGGGR